MFLYQIKETIIEQSLRATQMIRVVRKIQNKIVTLQYDAFGNRYR